MSPPTAVLFDFGGVLTTSVFAAFAAFGEAECGDAELPIRLLGSDEVAKRLLVDHEEGRLDHDAFESGFAERLRAHGAEVVTEGLVGRLQAGLLPDPEMVALVSDLRADGVRVGLLSNSLGRDCYAGWDLPAMFDAVTISGQEGVRKPSRRFYEIGCDRLGAAPGDVVMVDDLRQNIDAARRLGMAGIVHREAAATRRELESLLATAWQGAPVTGT